MGTIPLLYTVCCLIWGSTWVAIKLGLEGVPPFLGAGLRFSLAALVLAALAARRPKLPPMTRDDKIAIRSCGLVSFTLSYACVYWAEQYISSGLTAILFSTMPLIVALLSRFWTKAETLTGRKVGGILIAMGGTAILFWPGRGVSRAELLGMACGLASAAAAAVNLVTLKRHSRHTDIYRLNGWGMAIGGACLLALSLATESYAALVWTPQNVLAIVYLAVLGSVAAFLSYTYLVKHMDATPLSLISLIFPLVAVLLGWLILAETPTASTWLGMAVVLAGVAVASLSGRARAIRP
jgi:drug/metabolite transporter (DMT)-like permease